MSETAIEGWGIARVGDLVDCWGGMTPSTSNGAYWGGNIPWVSSKDVKQARIAHGTEYVTAKALQETRLRRCRPGTVLVVVRSGVLAHTLPIAIATDELVVNQDLKALDSGNNDVNEWLALYLRAHERDILEANRKDGTTVQSVRVEELLNRQFPIAPLAEQRRIVARVEALLAEVNSAQERLARVPGILKRFRQSVLAAACSGRLLEDWRKEPAEDDQDLPATWRVDKLLNIASDEPRSIQSGPFGSNLRHSEFKPTGKLVIGIDNVGDGRFLNGRQHRISEVKFRELQRYAARPLDVLVTVMATVGRVCVVPADIEPAIITKHVYRISTNREVMRPRFLECLLRGSPRVISQVRDQIRGQTRPGINGEILKRLELPIPPIREQEEIVARVSRLFEVADAIEQRMSVAQTRTHAVQQSILAKAFSGHLVPTEAEMARVEQRSYEPASAFLGRISAERERVAAKNTPTARHTQRQRVVGAR